MSVPKWVKAGEEFYLNDLTINFDYPSSTNPFDYEVITELQSPNFKINSENEAHMVHTFLDDVDLIWPPNHDGPVPVSLMSEGGIEIGPFIAGEEGEVIFKADEIRMNYFNDEFGLPLAIGFTCPLPEDEEFLLATIPIDGEAPVITLNGNNPMIVKQGDPYNEPGATANDNFDGDVSDDIEISGDVDTSTIGTYTVTYTVSDSVGNVATVERTVNVVEPFGDWYTGKGPPNDSLGNNGDSYLDLTTGDVYKRDPNTWTKVGNLKGDDGKRGNVILTGSGAPSADAGDIGDLYLDTNTGDVYEKTADGWKKTANLQGPAGPQGPKGPKGAAGTSGGSGSGDDGGGKSTTKTSTSSDKDGKGKSAQGGKLPKTATSLPALILIGSLLATAGGVLFLRRRKVME
ncbi:immunoglobulin-like domain-containing protein [Pueribacillus sp. YX66]|uniref:immunoglobulin-like domain-containing protein n=1 Tax=Pueribacillus sp. YX66 TaxID=3229242 RepID=UPI00358D10DC